MPKLKTVTRAQCDNVMHVQDALTPLAITRNQFTVLYSQLRALLPAHVTLAQRTPKSVVTVDVTRDGTTHRFKVTNRARVIMLD